MNNGFIGKDGHGDTDSFDGQLLRTVMEKTDSYGKDGQLWKRRTDPKKSDTIEIISLFLNARDYIPGNLMKLYLQLSILKRFRFVQIFGQSKNVLKCLTVNTISLNSQVYNHALLRAV